MYLPFLIAAGLYLIYTRKKIWVASLTWLSDVMIMFDCQMIQQSQHHLTAQLLQTRGILQWRHSPLSWVCHCCHHSHSYDINLNITMAFHMNISDRSRNITACLFDLWLHWFAEIAASDASSQYVDCLLENWSWRRWRQDQELRSQHNLLLTDTRLLYILDSPGRQLLP